MTPKQYLRRVGKLHKRVREANPSRLEKVTSDVEFERAELNEEFVRANTDFFIGDRIPFDRCDPIRNQTNKKYLFEVACVGLTLQNKTLKIMASGPYVRKGGDLNAAVIGIKDIKFDVSDIPITNFKTSFSTTVNLVDKTLVTVLDTCDAKKCDICKHDIFNRSRGDKEILCSIAGNLFLEKGF